MASIPKTADQIRSILLDRIRRELPGYTPGEKIPTYEELMAELPARRATLGRAIKGLQEEGALVGIQGGGVYVAERPEAGEADDPGASTEAGEDGEA